MAGSKPTGCEPAKWLGLKIAPKYGKKIKQNIHFAATFGQLQRTFCEAPNQNFNFLHNTQYVLK